MARVGDPISFPFRKIIFRTVVSQPESFDGHSRPRGLCLGCGGTYAPDSVFTTPGFVLVNALARLFAAAMGRSSAPSLRFEIRKLAVLALPGNLIIKYLYVPSVYTPAHAPSRSEVLPADGARLGRWWVGWAWWVPVGQSLGIHGLRLAVAACPCLTSTTSHHFTVALITVALGCAAYMLPLQCCWCSSSSEC